MDNRGLEARAPGKGRFATRDHFHVAGWAADHEGLGGHIATIAPGDLARADVGVLGTVEASSG